MGLENKKVLVTGAGGFIGSHLAEALVRKGCQVRAFVRYNSRNLWGWLEQSPLKGDMEIHTGDVADFDSVKAAMQGMDMVFHLAALIGIPYSYVSPHAYIRTNVEGTYNVLQAAREEGGTTVVQTSTSEVYGTALYTPIDEAHPLQPQSPYSATKISADCIAQSYYLSFGLPVVTVRPFNTYGPRQSARAIIPTIVSQVRSGAGEISMGSLHPRRDLNFVQDVVEGFMALAECQEAVGKTVNICSTKEISMGDLAALLITLMDSKCKVVSTEERVRPEASEVERLLGDNSRLTALTGWQPSHSLKEGLGQTIEWFSDPENLNLYKPEIYNV